MAFMAPLAVAAAAGAGAAGLGASTLTALGIAGTVGSLGMGIMGAAQQSQAQREAGDIAYQNALLRRQAAEQQAKQQELQAIQQENAANNEAAAGQRKAIEAKRRYAVAAGRARAVMAASGGGVDESLLAGIIGEGDYASDVELYQGQQKAENLKYGANVSRYQAGLDRYEGDTGVAVGERTRAARNRQADSSLVYGIGNAALRAGTMAAMYAGGPAPTDGAVAMPRSTPFALSDLDVNADNYGRL